MKEIVGLRFDAVAIYRDPTVIHFGLQLTSNFS